MDNYTRTFNAIGKAVTVSQGGALAISVKAFWDAYAAAHVAQQEPIAWMAEDGRVCNAKTKVNAMHARTADSYSIPLYAAPAAPQGEQDGAESLRQICEEGMQQHKASCAGLLTAVLAAPQGEPETEFCVVCDGRGLVGLHSMPCISCDGAGRIAVEK